MRRQTHFSPLGNYVVGPDGIYLELGTPIFNARFCTTKEISSASWKSAQIDHHDTEDDNVAPVFELKAPPPPAGLLEEAIGLFRTVMKIQYSKNNQCQISNDLIQREALAWMVYKEGVGWSLRVPKQTVSAYRVKSIPMTADDKAGVILHSHGMLPAYFSETDDLDEVDGFIYVVIGELHKEYPSIVMRAGYAGHFLDLNINDVFHAK